MATWLIVINRALGPAALRVIMLVLLSGCATVPAPHRPDFCVVETARQMMTLASIAYISEAQPDNVHRCVAHELTREVYATGGDFELVWGPVPREGNLVFLARRKHSTHYVVAIRGSDFEFVDDWLEDALAEPVPVSTNWWKPVKEERISRGIALALRHVRNMYEAPEDDGPKVYLLEVLKAAARDSSITVTVTGHSLGGGMTTVVMPWLQAQLDLCEGCKPSIVNGYSFAGQTAGNKAFARHFDDAFHGRLCRVVNPLDVVPHGYAGFLSIVAEGIPTRVPELDPPIGEALVGIDAYLGIRGWDYQQVAAEWVTDHYKAPDPGYVKQVEEQHNHNCYLALLNAPQMASTGSYCSLEGLPHQIRVPKDDVEKTCM